MTHVCPLSMRGTICSKKKPADDFKSSDFSGGLLIILGERGVEYLSALVNYLRVTCAHNINLESTSPVVTPDTNISNTRESSALSVLLVFGFIIMFTGA